MLFGRIGCQLLLRSVLLMTLMKTVEFGQSWVVPEAWLPVWILDKCSWSPLYGGEMRIFNCTSCIKWNSRWKKKYLFSQKDTEHRKDTAFLWLTQRRYYTTFAPLASIRLTSRAAFSLIVDKQNQSNLKTIVLSLFVVQKLPFLFQAWRKIYIKHCQSVQNMKIFGKSLV